MTNWVDKECRSVEWYTPPYILDAVRQYFFGPIPLDPATTVMNPVEALRFYTLETDGLSKPWDASVFVNPPYGKAFPSWCEKIGQEAEHNTTIIALLPCGARFSTKYWQTNILKDRLKSWCFLNHRVSFLAADGAPESRNPYDSQILGFNTNPITFARAFNKLGVCLTVEVILEAA
jgi:hypothetical protein